MVPSSVASYQTAPPCQLPGESEAEAERLQTGSVVAGRPFVNGANQFRIATNITKFVV